MSVAAVRTACCLAAVLAAASVTIALAATDLDDARRLIAAKDYAPALKAARRALKAQPRSAEALLLASSAELGLHDFAAAEKRLRHAPPGCGECDALVAMAAHLDAERNPKLRMPAVREQRRMAENAASKALASGSHERNVYLVRTMSDLVLGRYDDARDAAAAWEAAYPKDAEAAAARGKIEEARSRWAALDERADGSLSSHRQRAKRERALVSKVAPDGDGSEAKEIDALLAAEPDRQTRAQLLVLRIALRESLGKAELAVLEGWEAGFLDEKHAVKAALAVRRLDPNDRVDPALHLDGASKPVPLKKEAKGLKVDDTHGRLAADVLYRVEPSGRVGPVLPLFGFTSAAYVATVADLKTTEYRPAIRDGAPVAVPMHCELSEFAETISITVSSPGVPW